MFTDVVMLKKFDSIFHEHDSLPLCLTSNEAARLRLSVGLNIVGNIQDIV